MCIRDSYWYKLKSTKSGYPDSEFSSPPDRGNKKPSGPEWHFSVAYDGTVGDLELEVVDGNPAVAFQTNSWSLKFVRADDQQGTSWGTDVDIDSNGVNGNVSLEVISEKPAVSYMNTGTSLMFARALDKDGDSWGSPVSVDSGSDLGWGTSLTTVNGNPAVSYVDGSDNHDLMYVRANDNTGSLWGEPITVDAAHWVRDDVKSTSLAIISGKPAISYMQKDQDDLMFVRSSDENGNAWQLPTTVTSDGYQTMITLLNVNGKPAIAYRDWNSGNADAKYVRATNSTGSSWGSPITVDSLGQTEWVSMAIVGDVPAIANYLGNTFEYRDLRWAQAADQNGSSWNSPETVDSEGEVGEFASIKEVNGHPAIAYFDHTNDDLKFAIYY